MKCAITRTLCTMTVFGCLLLDSCGSREEKELNESLIKASIEGRIEDARLLLDKGADLNFKDAREGMANSTPLGYAAYYGHTDLARLFLSRGANPNIAAHGGWTPLLISSVEGNVELVKATLGAGADVDAKNSEGFTALHLCALKGREDIAILLLENGAVLSVKNDQGETPLDAATRMKHESMVALLTNRASAGNQKRPDGGYNTLSNKIGDGTHPAHEWPSPAQMGIHRQKYHDKNDSVLETILCRTYKLPCRCEAFDSSGRIVRTARFTGFSKETQTASYDIYYPGYGLTSHAQFRLGGSCALLEEIFAKKWRIVYEYNQQHSEDLKIPHSYSVYSYLPEQDSYSQLLDTCTHLEQRKGIARYRTKSGRTVDRDVLYFSVLSEAH